MGISELGDVSEAGRSVDQPREHGSVQVPGSVPIERTALRRPIRPTLDYGNPAFERQLPGHTPIIELPSPSEALEHLATGAAKEFVWWLAEAGADLCVPWAGRALHTARTAFKVFDVVGGVLQCNGLELSETVLTPWGFGIEFATTVGADHPTPLLSVEPEWTPLRPAETRPSVEFGIEAGRQPEDQPRVAVDTRWFEADLPSSVGRARVGVVESAHLPGQRAQYLQADVAGLAMAAPARTVKGRATALSAPSVVTYAERCGWVTYDPSVDGWHVNLGERSGVLAYRRRRRIRWIAYQDPHSGFVGIVELGDNRQARFVTLVLPVRTPL
jgi:hypothetical protein